VTDGADSAQTFLFAVFLKNLTDYLQVNVQLILCLFYGTSVLFGHQFMNFLQVDLEHLMAALSLYCIQGSLAAL